mmetsp:Transcript_83491/g.235413  ORF Transcript_83491/g.235413 Transcript_83491/m.235413 type:complete len:206 (-) Transcript_83491:497-1114(-)
MRRCRIALALSLVGNGMCMYLCPGVAGSPVPHARRWSTAAQSRKEVAKRHLYITRAKRALPLLRASIFPEQLGGPLLAVCILLRQARLLRRARPTSTTRYRARDARRFIRGVAADHRRPFRCLLRRHCRSSLRHCLLCRHCLFPGFAAAATRLVPIYDLGACVRRVLVSANARPRSMCLFILRFTRCYFLLFELWRDGTHKATLP